MGDCTASWAAGDDTKVYEAWSKNGTLNEGAETDQQCTERLIKEMIESRILGYFKEKDGRVAEDAASGVTVS